MAETEAAAASPTGTVRSPDGTPIAYWRSGAGSALVLVHGSTADHTRWSPVLSPLEQHFAVHTIDRRGRGASGDAEPYAVQREFEDVASLVDSIGGPVDLLGHSYGALCCLEAALVSTNLRHLVLYEPPIPTGIAIYPPEAVRRMEALLEEGQRETALELFFREVVRMPPHELDLLRSRPVWKARVAAAHTVLREMQGSDSYRFQQERFQELRVPTLLLLGGDSPAFLKAATASVAGALPNCQVVELPGQQHLAMDTAPELFLREVLSFLQG